MAITAPIVVNIWRYASPPPAAPVSTTAANLMMGLRRSNITLIESVAAFSSFLYLCVAKGYDIRGWWDGSGGDYVEAPAGTNRYYQVMAVDDVGKGFSNEYRIAFMQQVTQPFALFGIPFPVPLP